MFLKSYFLSVMWWAQLCAEFSVSSNLINNAEPDMPLVHDCVS